MKKTNLTELIIYVVSAELVGAVSTLLSGGFSGFFEKYAEPPLLPPSWLFPVVWTILYAVMGLSAYMISSSAEPGDSARKYALTIYWAQLAVNFSWSIVFFRFEALWAAFGVIILLLGLIAAMILSFRRINPVAAYINLPYLAWVIFASYLNLATAVIN